MSIRQEKKEKAKSNFSTMLSGFVLTCGEAGMVVKVISFQNIQKGSRRQLNGGSQASSPAAEVRSRLRIHLLLNKGEVAPDFTE
jgi:hypothetical protein